MSKAKAFYSNLLTHQLKESWEHRIEVPLKIEMWKLYFEIIRMMI